MSEFPRPIPMPRRSSEAGDRLDSWKEIAAYLGREVRTVQGWEKNEGLPVHRHQHARQGSVYAFKAELDVWRASRKGVAEELSPVSVEEPAGSARWLVWGAGALAAVLAAGGFFFWKQRTAAPPAGEALSSIVVLPFLDLSPQKDQEYFSDGLTEEIIDALSRVPNLRVVARTTAFAFKGRDADIRQIGRQLNVSAVLEGSVRKAGDQLRITAQLNRVSDGYHLWSRTYDQQLRDVFAVQQKISQSIADQLRAGPVPQRAAVTADLAAYDLYQEGLYFFNKHEPPDSYWKAIDRYQKAIQRDPKFALAYAGMADAYAYLAENFAVWPKEIMPKAKEAAEKAVALNDNLAEAHTSVGIVKMDFEWDREGAQRELARALQLNPGSGWVHHWIAHSLETQGRLEDAMKEMRYALELDPLSLPIHWDIGNELLMARKFDEALQFLNKADELFPNQPFTAWEKSSAYHYKGEGALADQTMAKFLAANQQIRNDPTILSMQGMADGFAGRRAEARQILDRLEELHKTQYVEPFIVAGVCNALGDHQCLMRWVERGYEERSTFFLYAPLAWYLYDDDPEVRTFLAQHR